MREFLFKAKRKNWKELPKEEWWVYGYPIEQDHPEYHAYIVRSINIEMDDGHTDILSQDIVEVDPETVCQYTGLSDKNDRKIFDGDIIKIHQFLFDGSENENEITVSVEYMSDMACFGANLLQAEEIRRHMGYENETDFKVEKVVIPLNDFHGLHEESFEIIGNIFDNPELTDGGK